jgi:hypothetical protein
MRAALKANGNEMDRAQEAKARSVWFKNPQRVVLSTDSDAVRSIKLTHIATCKGAMKPWKIAYRIWLTLLAIGIGALLFS